MVYKEFQPHPALTPCIDAYWTVTGDLRELKSEKIFPDGCIDLIFNLGTACKTDNGNFTMQPEKIYLVGTMTGFKKVEMVSETKLLGVRFKPAAFPFFYKFSSLHEITDVTIEFEKKLSPDLQKTVRYSASYLDDFFIKRLSTPKNILLPVIADLQHHKGRMDVSALAEKHCMTIRELQRRFKQQIGIGPKEFSNITRYQFAHAIIQNGVSNRSLLDIAFECGYYDHSHLTNEFKRFTGIVPSEF